MHIAAEYVYIYIYIWNSFILQAYISISSHFMHIAREYVYTYIYIWTRSSYGLVPPIIACFGDARG